MAVDRNPIRLSYLVHSTVTYPDQTYQTDVWFVQTCPSGNNVARVSRISPLFTVASKARRKFVPFLAIQPAFHSSGFCWLEEVSSWRQFPVGGSFQLVAVSSWRQFPVGGSFQLEAVSSWGQFPVGGSFQLETVSPPHSPPLPSLQVRRPIVRRYAGAGNLSRRGPAGPQGTRFCRTNFC
jgi:hypothetical protein